MDHFGTFEKLKVSQLVRFLSGMIPEVYYYVHKGPPRVTILSQINLVRVQPSRIVTIHFSIYLYLCLGLPSDVIPSYFPTKTVCLSSVPYMAHHPLHSTPLSISSLVLTVMMLPISQVVPSVTFCLHTSFLWWEVASHCPACKLEHHVLSPICNSLFDTFAPTCQMLYAMIHCFHCIH